jgi:hypothetical protein
MSNLKQLVTLEESMYPRIYAFAFILNHGESQMPRLQLTTDKMPHMDQLERELHAFSFSDVVSYCTLIDDSTTLGDIHESLFCLVVGFPEYEEASHVDR